MQAQDLSYKLNNDHIELNDQFFNTKPKISVEVFSFENVYTIPNFNKDNGIFKSQTIVWGNTEQVDGSVDVSIKCGEINVDAKLDQNIRSIKVRFDDLPLGKLISLTDFDTEITEYGSNYKYPEGWRHLSHPLLVFKLADNRYLYIRCVDKTVNQKMFFLKKVGDKMRVDVVQEQNAANISNHFIMPKIEYGIRETKEEIFVEQSKYMEKTFNLVPFEKTPIAPSWLKNISLVVIMHMETFTGHIFHTYEKAYEDVKKLTKMMPAENILVYFAGWEGRYYHKYGMYTADERMGGEKALKESIAKIKNLGCKTMAMYGINIVNKDFPNIKAIADKAEFVTPSGGRFHNGSVDWEGAHHYDFGRHANLNIANKLWQDDLFNQIKEVTLKFDFDGAFLDIAAVYVNDARNSLFEGVVEFCNRLRTIKRDFLVSGEGFYDGLAKAFPLFQSGHTDGYMNYHDRISEEVFTKYSREFAHLCLGDPSRGSSGVHELGTNDMYKTPFRKGIIPTISLVENSLEDDNPKVMEIISDAIRYKKEFLD